MYLSNVLLVIQILITCLDVNLNHGGSSIKRFPICLFLSGDGNQPFGYLKFTFPSVPLHGRCGRAKALPPPCVHNTESHVYTMFMASTHPLMERSLNRPSSPRPMKLEHSVHKYSVEVTMLRFHAAVV